MNAHKILKVIYAPHKAFNEIIQDPRYAGPILIMILFLAAETGSSLTIISRSYIEQTFPKGEHLDIWTEDSTLWRTSSGVTARNNYSDYIKGTYYGNSSIEFSIIDRKQMSIELDDIGSADCYGPEGYKNLSLRTKLLSPQKPENVTIYLFSITPGNYFYYDLTEEFSSFTLNAWNNLTIPVGSEGWLSNNATTNWNNITGLRLMFIWPTNTNATSRVDGLFFRGFFKSVLDVAGIQYLFVPLLTVFLKYLLEWTFVSGLIYIISRGFGAKIPWMTLMVCIGFTLIPMLMQVAVDIATRSTLPPLYYPLELVGGVEGEFQIAHNMILETTSFVSQISGYVQTVGYMWTILLCTIATHFMTGFSWVKSLLVSATAFVITILILSFLLVL